MADSYQSAQSELDNTGSTTLQPSTAVWTFLRWMLLATAVLTLVPAVVILVINFSVSFALGLIPLVAIIAGLWTWWLRRLGQKQDHPVLVSSAGITVKGVGPVPWQFLEPPEMRWQHRTYDSGRQELPVLPFTAQGLEYAQRDLTEGQRRRLAGLDRPPFVDPTVLVRLPAKIKGLSRDEYLSLLTAAHTRFAQPR